MSRSSQFLVRPKPLEGESLSSWRQRSAWRNGYILFPVTSEKLRRVDPDIGLHEAELVWLASGHNVDRSTLVPLTLAGQRNVVVRHLAPHSQPSWWLRGRVAGTNEKTGPMFCPVCLKNDEQPFFRLHWRFAFVASCPIHRVEMLDRCPTCGEAAWPGGAGMSSRLSSTFVAFNQCWACGSDLCQTSAVTACAATDAFLLEAVRNRTVALGSAEFPTVDTLEALRAICHLFIRSRTRQVILKSGSKWCDVLAKLSPGGEDNRTIELMDVNDRRLLVEIAWRVIADWPISFRKFSSECGLLKWHFDGASQLSPEWMNLEIASNLARQNRSVTKVVLDQTFKSLSDSLGRPPRKSEMKQQFARRGRKLLDDLYPLRCHATGQEIEQLLINAENELQRCGARRLSLFHAAVDISVIVICIVDQHHVETVRVLTALQLEVRLAEMGNGPRQKATDLIGVLRDSLRTYSTARKMAYSAKPRQIRKRFSSLLQNAPEDLTRSVSAYWIVEG